MIVFIDELGRNRVVRSSLSVELCLGTVAGVWVARLNHESVDDPVEKQAVVVVFAHELAEIVPVSRCLAVEFHADCSLRRDDVEFRFAVLYHSYTVFLFVRNLFSSFAIAA